LASSMNMIKHKDTSLLVSSCFQLIDRLDGDEPSGRAFVLELDNAWDFREQRVVFANADVQTRLELGAVLPDKDRSAGNEHTIMALDAEPLRVAVAPVS